MLKLRVLGLGCSTSNKGVVAGRRQRDNAVWSFPDRRDPARNPHTLADMIRARVSAISCGYEDADDLDRLLTDPAFKLACGRLPESSADLCSQPTLSRLENAPSLKDAIRLTSALVDQWMASYVHEPVSVILDIDDTCDVVHPKGVRSPSVQRATPITLDFPLSCLRGIAARTFLQLSDFFIALDFRTDESCRLRRGAS